MNDQQSPVQAHRDAEATQKRRSVSRACAALRGRFAKSGLSRNALFGVGQSFVVTLCVFLVYRLVVANAGIERLGVWSLLLASAAVVRVADVSGAGALARFVAIGSRAADTHRARDTVHTVMLTSICLNSIFGIIFSITAPFVLPMFVVPHYLGEAEVLVPWVCAQMVLGGLAVGVTSSIDGAQRADQRAVVVIAAAVVFLITGWLLVPRYAVAGFGAALVLQQLTILVVGWAVLRRHVADLGWLPHRWRQDVFSETTGYAVKLNAIGVVDLLFDPLVKFSFNHAGGPGAVTLYELASRLVTQIRALAIAGATPLVPAFAARYDPKDTAFRHTLERATRVATIAAFGVALASLAGGPMVSFCVLGNLSPKMLNISAALTLGWSLQLPCLAFYLAAQGAGVLRWNFLGHALVAASVLMGVFLFIPAFGLDGLIGAIVAGLIISMLTVLVGNAQALGATDIVWRLGWWLLGAGGSIMFLFITNNILLKWLWPA